MGRATLVEELPCVKLRGLPADACKQGVASFLRGLDVLDVVPVYTTCKHPVGEVVVLLANLLSVDYALARSGLMYGLSTVVVTPASKLEYFTAVVGSMSKSNLSSSADWLQSALPRVLGPGTTPFLNGCPTQHSSLPETSPRQLHHSSSLQHQPPSHRLGPLSHSPDTLATMPLSLSDQHAALPPALARSAPPGFLSVFTSGLATGPSLPVGCGSHPGRGILKLRGLPFAATAEDVAIWFNGAGLPIKSIVSEDVIVLLNPAGRSSGQAFAAFQSLGEAKCALSLDRQWLGNRYVEIFMSSQQEMEAMCAQTC